MIACDLCIDGYCSDPRCRGGRQCQAAFCFPPLPSTEGTGGEGSAEHIFPGAVFSARYPFVREEHDSDEGGLRLGGWRPGVRFPADEAVADGEGKILLTVVSTYKPPGYSRRVFYIRRWRDPAGHEFGSRLLRVASIAKFRRLARGYGYPYSFFGRWA